MGKKIIENSPTLFDFGVVILAGGKSTRMGYPKPWLEDDKKNSFAEKLVKKYKEFGCEKIVLVINEDFCRPPWTSKIELISQNANIIKNTQPEKGRFFSLQLAASQLISSDYVFIQNVDNPFVNLRLLQMLLINKVKNGYTVPTFGRKGGHPILVSREIIRLIDKMEDHTLNLRNVLMCFNRKNVMVPWQKILANINTPEKYEEYLKNKNSRVCS
ncbi:MAG: NTP transferase domain-containing protein [Bacteroidetes bacterium]|nr:NTP transferase domain-containing protein [Bacteroidota bacterium]